MSEEPLFYSIAGMATGITMFIRGVRGLLLKRMIRNIPTSKVRSIAMGLVEVYGEAVPAEHLKTPLSGKDCVYYKLEIEAETDALDSSGVMVKALRGGKNTKGSVERGRFYLRDATGKVLVDPRGAELEESCHKMRHRGAKFPRRKITFPDGRKDERRGVSLAGEEEVNSRSVYTEYYIAPGDKLYVLGTAARKPGTGCSPRHTENILIRRGKNDPVFYISKESEKKALSRLDWRTISGIFGGAILANVSFLLFLVSLFFLFA
jgi:hypothetical protein